MNKHFLIILTLAFIGCSEAPEQIIDQHLRMIGDLSEYSNITTVANCSGPDGPYTTRTQSSLRDGYLLFQQDYSYRKNPFYALILSREEGYGLDTTLTSQGPLSEAIIAVLKAHEFHEMMFQPNERYSGMNQIEDTVFFNQPCKQIIASDHLGLPVRLYFDKTTKLMAGIAQANPYKKGEVIQVHFEGWLIKDGVKLFHTVQIKQGKTDEYLFEFENITFNKPDFQRLDP